MQEYQSQQIIPSKFHHLKKQGHDHFFRPYPGDIDECLQAFPSQIPPYPKVQEEN